MNTIKGVIFSLLFLLGTNIYAQSPDTTSQSEGDTTSMVETAEENEQSVEEASERPVIEAVENMDPVETETVHQIIKDKFIEGGVLFMGIVLTCLILGLAIAIERVITINLATINTKKFISDVDQALNTGGVEKAQDLSARTPGPIASIYSQGFSRLREGLSAVEKSIVSYGSVEMGKLEKGLTWISLFISLAPMLGFMGTVIGMIEAFDTIEQAEDIKIDEVASGIKVALLTTVAGLIVAVILQVFYNYLVSKIDSLVNQMEESSVNLVDMIVDKKLTE